ncbi:protein dcl [Quercus suber]|uniref:Protein dcl n=1 Tax=Quercus suber TaxID=58331 RepID=A0AAW0L2K7_QUESU
MTHNKTEPVTVVSTVYQLSKTKQSCQSNKALAMALISKIPPRVHFRTNPIPLHFSPVAVILSFPPPSPFPTTSLHLHHRTRFCVCALKTGPDGYGSDLLRKPIISPDADTDTDTDTDTDLDTVGVSEKVVDSEGTTEYEESDDDDEKFVDWEDRILEDTVPLVGFIGYHPEFERSRCLFIVRKDGQLVDFSYWKCIKGLIRKNYPLYADSFILRHFRKQRRSL